MYKSLGFEIEDELVNKILTSLEFKVTPKEDSFEIIAPTFRSTKDITIAADIVEEISRMYGYENFEHIPLKWIVHLLLTSQYLMMNTKQKISSK